MDRITKYQLYKRQTTLTEVGEEGQQKLLKTKVLVVGCGGLGSAVAVYLAGSGIGEINLVDFDKVTTSNLHRQVFYKIEDIGVHKADVLAKHINAVSPFIQVNVSKKSVSKSNVFDFASGVDFIVDCTDSLPIKYLLNDACVLNDKSLIYGSLYKFDGYVSSFNVKTSEGIFSTNLRDAFPEISKQQIPNCSEIGTMNSIVGIIGLMQANEVLKLVLGIGKPLINKILIYNSLENTQFKMKLKSSYTKEHIRAIYSEEDYYDASCEVQDPALLISSDELRNKLLSPKDAEGIEIISVIEDINALIPFKVNVRIPLSKLNLEEQQFDLEKKYVIICNRGISSYEATKRIKKQHPKLKILSLEKGIINY